MENKNPFEIRLEVLKMAKDHLDQESNNERNRLMDEWHMQCECIRNYNNARENWADSCHKPIPDVPKLSYPTADAIIKLAEKFQRVVNKKD
jgi:hypothetical protein